MQQLIPTLVGTFWGILWAAFGYAIARAKAGEEFELGKFAKTIVIGIIMAGVAQGLGVDVARVEGMSISALATVIVDKIAGLALKAIPSKAKA